MILVLETLPVVPKLLEAVGVDIAQPTDSQCKKSVVRTPCPLMVSSEALFVREGRLTRLQHI